MPRRALLLISLMLYGASAIPSSQVRSQPDALEVLSRVEERLRGLEESWTKVDQRLQQGAAKLDLLTSKIDRIEKSIGNRALYAQRAAERAASTCQKLNQGALFTKKVPSDADGQHAYKEILAIQQDAINKEASSVTSRMTNMYNDLWRRSLILEDLMKESLNLTGASRKESREGIRSVAQAMRRNAAAPQYSNAEAAVYNLSKTVQRRLNEVDAKVTVKFQELSSAQNAFQTSCQRIQLNEEQMETNIVKVLDGLMVSLSTIMNKTIMTQEGLQRIHDSVDSHGTQITKAIKKWNNVTLSYKEDHKTLMATISDERRQSQEGLIPFGRKFDSLLTLLQELQEEMSYTFSHQKRQHESNPKGVCENFKDDLQKLIKDNLVRFRDEERDSLVEKLTSAVETLQLLIENMEDKDDVENTELDTNESNDEGQTNLDNKGSWNIMSPKELIDKLNKINLEKSPEIQSGDDDYYEEKHKRKHRNSKDGLGKRTQSNVDASSKSHHKHKMHPNNTQDKKDAISIVDADEAKESSEYHDETKELNEYYDENDINLSLNS